MMIQQQLPPKEALIIHKMKPPKDSCSARVAGLTSFYVYCRKWFPFCRFSFRQHRATIRCTFSALSPCSDASHAALAGRLGHCLGNRRANPRIKRLGDDVVFIQLFAGQSSQSLRRGDLHFFIDLRGAHIQRAAENSGKRQNVVDLVGIVAAARGNDPCAAGASVVRKNSPA